MATTCKDKRSQGLLADWMKGPLAYDRLFSFALHPSIFTGEIKSSPSEKAHEDSETLRFLRPGEYRHCYATIGQVNAILCLPILTPFS